MLGLTSWVSMDRHLGWISATTESVSGHIFFRGQDKNAFKLDFEHIHVGIFSSDTCRNTSWLATG